jgi:3-deoxy-D-manno-octulosonic-acid transferase
MGLLHSAALIAAAPVYLLPRLVRGRYRESLRARLGGGIDGAAWTHPPAGPRVHVHACSVGEVGATAPLVGAWKTVRPDLPPFVTTITETGQAAARARFADLPVGYLPFDIPWCLRRVLGPVDLRLLVLVETEIWPNLVEFAAARGAPVAVASGRISDRAWPRYRLAAPLLRSTFRRIALVCAQTDLDAERFAALGARRVEVAGNVKFDVEPLAPIEPRPAGPARIFVAGSVHPAEFAAVAEAIRRARRAGDDLRAVVAPRHTERAAEAEAALRAAGLEIDRRSRIGSPAAWRAPVLLLDVMGELGRWYGVADVAFVGGTIAPVGGHNLMEPAAAGVPVLHGPRVENQREAAWLLAGRGAVEVSAATLGPALVGLLADGAERRRLRDLARSAAAAHRGAARRTADRIAALI